MQMKSKRRVAPALKYAALVALAMLVAMPSVAQNVLYNGTLMIGFGDPLNKPPTPGATDFGNDGLPACAQTDPYAPATFATVPVVGYATKAAPAKGSIMFPEYSPRNDTAQTGGGQVPITAGTCFIPFPPWLGGGQVRSRAQFGSQVWPGKHLNGAFTALTTVPGAGGGTLAPGGGVAAAFSFAPVSFYDAAAGGTGMIAMTPGAANFGGGVPVNNNGNVKLGANDMPYTGIGGVTLMTFGVKGYAEGFLPTGPAVFGTSAAGAPAGEPVPPVGARAGNAFTWNHRTPGPMTPGVTTMGGFTQGALETTTTDPGGLTIPQTTMGDFNGIFQKWTTGMARHTDMSGMYTTVRAATGHDWTTAEFAANATTAPNGTTRKLQLVTPWSASIQKRGDNPDNVINFQFTPNFGFGGLAVLTLDIIPVPEPGTLSMLGFGAAGLMGLGAIRRRNGR